MTPVVLLLFCALLALLFLCKKKSMLAIIVLLKALACPNFTDVKYVTIEVLNSLSSSYCTMLAAYGGLTVRV